MLQNIKTIDLHQDILISVNYPESQKDNSQTDFNMLKLANIKVVLGSVFPVPPESNFFHTSVNSLISQDINTYINQCKLDPDFSIILNSNDITKAIQSKGKYGILIHIEGLNNFKGTKNDWQLLNDWYNKGLRSIGPVWNFNNSLGGGAQNNLKGLTPIGIELIKWAQQRGVIIDFAHMSPKTFSDAANISSKPIFVSHGNAFDVCPKIRNYTKSQLFKIAESNGVVGIFFAGNYIKSSGILNIDNVVDHIDSIKKVIGINHIAIGSDFGGIINRKVPGLSKSADIINLYKALDSKKYTLDQIHKIASGNAFRVISDNLI